MGLKKYEIITVGSDKRVRALRSWQVGDRYVNIGDVGGIVYDEKTLSQDGACWLFRGNFGFPGARIGGDSIVDVGEAALSAVGTPAVDILGSSVVVGSKLQFSSDQTAADAVVLTADDFEQGVLAYAAGANWETWKLSSPHYLRTKSPIFMGGAGVTLKVDVPGYAVQAYVLDRDGIGIAATALTDTGAGVTLAIPAGQYFLIRLSKKPAADIAPSDATAARIAFTGTYETKLSIIDSRLEVGPANSTGTTTIKPGGTYMIASGTKYPEAIIRNSRVSTNVPANTSRAFRLLGQIIGSTATLYTAAGDVKFAGVYSNVKNLTATGSISPDLGVTVYGIIQATDCDNFVVSPTIFPGTAAAQTANMPFIFQGCNVPNGRFYHHAGIANTYKNIDFALAEDDLGKLTVNGFLLVSSEVNSMYRVYSGSAGIFGGLVESHESVKSATIYSISTAYGTTIYKDAYLRGTFDLAGTNVFGNKVRSHPLAQVLNVQPRAVQGDFDNVSPGGVITQATGVSNRVCVLESFKVNSGQGLSVDNIPAGIGVSAVYVTPVNTVVTSTGWANTSWKPAAPALAYYAAYLRFKKSDDTAITPEDLAGVTVTVYNGCKIVNTGTTVVNMKGNIRVEDNATLVNASVTGSGYFGGNSVVYYNPAIWASLDFNGTVFMKDNAVFAPSALTGANALVRMEGKAKFTGSVDVASTNLSFIMRDNAVIEGKANTRSGVVMSGNSRVTASGQIMAASRGVLVMEENASIEANTTVIGAITLSGNYKGNVVKKWTGKRTITDVNAPTYDDNVKTKYDF